MQFLEKRNKQDKGVGEASAFYFDNTVTIFN